MSNYTSDDFLQPELMLRLYANGAFPMADEEGSVNWFLPEIRTIIPLQDFNIPRSFRKIIPQLGFNTTYDTSVMTVIDKCSERTPTWISDKLKTAYKRLHKRKHVHSVEVWKNEQLVGGLYGITFRGAFFGESMFSTVSQASKFALLKLIEHLNDKDFTLLDVQYMTDHLKMFGAVEISMTEYTSLLQKAYEINCEF
jgi:leucyl/phenylalanyl-tRNA---protein transferase